MAQNLCAFYHSFGVRLPHFLRSNDCVGLAEAEGGKRRETSAFFFLLLQLARTNECYI
jgi:hypothetical protein